MMSFETNAEFYLEMFVFFLSNCAVVSLSVFPVLLSNGNNNARFLLPVVPSNVVLVV